MDNGILENFNKRKEYIRDSIEEKKELCINRIKSQHFDSALTIIQDIKELLEQQYFMNQIIEGYIS